MRYTTCQAKPSQEPENVHTNKQVKIINKSLYVVIYHINIHVYLYFSDEKVFGHLPTRNTHGIIKGRNIESRSDGISKTKRQHKRNPACGYKSMLGITGPMSTQERRTDLWHTRAPSILRAFCIASQHRVASSEPFREYTSPSPAGQV